jgi:hypothetical protein
MHASKNAVRAGSPVTFFGFLESTAQCAVGEIVEIQRRIVGPNERWTEHKREVTDANGEFESFFRIWKNAEYRTLVRRDRFCQREESTSVLVNARVRVIARVDDHTPERDTNFRIFGRVEPSHDGTEIHFQWRRNGRWRTVFSQPLSDRSTFSFFPLADWDRRKVRIKWPRGDFDHIAGYSRVVIVRTHS